MAKDEFPGFDGWAVEHSTGGNGRHEFMFRKDHPAGKDGKLTVWSVVGSESDPMIAYLSGKREAHAEDLRVASTNETEAAQKKFDASHQAVVKGKVERHVVKALDRGEDPHKVGEYAAARLLGAGIPIGDAQSVLEKTLDRRLATAAGSSKKE